MMEETPNDALASVDPERCGLRTDTADPEGYTRTFPEARPRQRRHRLRPRLLPREVAGAVQIFRHVRRALRTRGVLVGRSSRAHFTPLSDPGGRPLRATATDRVVLAGDAGGFVNGITAEGIYYAMVSGDLAGRALCWRRRTEHSSACWRDEIGGELATRCSCSAIF